MALSNLNLSSIFLRVVDVFMIQLPSCSEISITGVEEVAAYNKYYNR
jgi:hypothetical protein